MQTDFLPLALLPAAMVAALVLAFLAPPSVFLVADLGVRVVPGEWNVSNSRVDLADVVLLGLFVRLLVRGRPADGASWREVPWRGAWLLLGTLLSLAYLVAPDNQPNLTDPIRIAYQLYRYCWKPILFYPLCAMFLTTRPAQDAALFTLVATAGVWSLQGIAQGMQGQSATGPFTWKNELGGALVLPFLFALSGFLRSATRGTRLFYGASLLLIGRAFLFTNSRGAQVATLVGGGIVVCGMLTVARFRPIVIRTAGVAVATLTVLLLLKPEILEGPNLRYVFTAAEGGDAETMQWRREERWPHFRQIVADNPWLGIGTDVDASLGTSGNTPHNGYLSMALYHGVPALALVVAFALHTCANGVRLFRTGTDRSMQVLGLTIAAGIVALLLHNTVDSTLVLPFPMKLLWLGAGLSGTALRTSKRMIDDRGAVAGASEPPPARTRAAPLPLSSPR